jgi:hypothetical protein
VTCLNSTIFVPLLNGVEKPELVRLRCQTYETLWKAQAENIDVSRPQMLTHRQYINSGLGGSAEYTCKNIE